MPRYTDLDEAREYANALRAISAKFPTVIKDRNHESAFEDMQSEADGLVTKLEELEADELAYWASPLGKMRGYAAWSGEQERG